MRHLGIWIILFLSISPMVHAAGIRVPFSETTFNVIQLDGLRAILNIKSSEIEPIELIITGPKEKARNIAVDQFGQVLVIRPKEEQSDDYDFRGIDEDTVATITMVVPPHVELALLNFSGHAEIGNIDGRVSIQGGRSEVTVGHVQELDVNRWGSGFVKVGNVALVADVTSKGSANIEIGNVAELRIIHIGSGPMKVGHVTSSLFYNGAGSGSLRVEKLEGAGMIESNGSGEVLIVEGRADPFFVTLNGEGAVHMEGTAVNPVIRRDDQGEIYIGKIVGLKQEGPAQAKFPLEWDESIGQ